MLGQAPQSMSPGKPDQPADMQPPRDSLLSRDCIPDLRQQLLWRTAKHSCRFPGSPHPGSSTSLPLESGLAWLLALINKTWWECMNSSLDPSQSQSFHSSEHFCQCFINKAQPARQRVRFWAERGPRWAPDTQGRPSETT